MVVNAMVPALVVLEMDAISSNSGSDTNSDDDDDIPPFVSVSCGPFSTFAIGSDGKLWSWGYDGFSGCLGRGTITSKTKSN